MTKRFGVKTSFVKQAKVMSKKTCDAFFCGNQTPKKYRYCYDCARSRGLVGNNGLGFFGWAVILLIIWVLFG